MTDDIITVTPRGGRGLASSPDGAICWEIHHYSARAASGVLYGRILRNPADAGCEAAALSMRAKVPLLIDPEGCAARIEPGETFDHAPSGLDDFADGLNHRVTEKHHV